MRAECFRIHKAHHPPRTTFPPVGTEKQHRGRADHTKMLQQLLIGVVVSGDVGLQSHHSGQRRLHVAVAEGFALPWQLPYLAYCLVQNPSPLNINMMV